MRRQGNMFKGAMVMALAGAMAAGMAMTSFAAGWQKNDTGWWYGTNADNTTWHANGWQWIDSNNDGVAECYYFDANGYMLANTTTPDGYMVNADGAWTENGVVQTQVAQADTSVNTYNSQGVSNIALEMVENTREENAKFGEVDVHDPGSNCVTVTYANGFKMEYYQSTYVNDITVADQSNGKLLFKYYDSSITSGKAMESYLHGLGLGFGVRVGSSSSCTISLDDRHTMDWGGGKNKYIGLNQIVVPRP